MHFNDDWKELNKEQKYAIKDIEGNHIVLAPAGTGKTKVIAMRTSYLLLKGIHPNQILNLTFTNKAAREMEDRIRKYNPQEVKGLTIKTFHSFCYYIINNEKDHSHFTFPCTIIDEEDSKAIIERIPMSKGVQ